MGSTFALMGSTGTRALPPPRLQSLSCPSSSNSSSMQRPNTLRISNNKLGTLPRTFALGSHKTHHWTTFNNFPLLPHTTTDHENNNKNWEAESNTKKKRTNTSISPLFLCSQWSRWAIICELLGERFLMASNDVEESLT